MGVSAAAMFKALGDVRVARLVADATLNNVAVLTDLSGMSFQVGASDLWEVELIIRTSRAGAAAQNTSFAFNIPAAASIIHQAFGSAANESDGTQIANMTITNSTSVKAYRTKLLYLGGANAGTVKLQWQQTVAEAQDHYTKANSLIIATRLA